MLKFAVFGLLLLSFCGAGAAQKVSWNGVTTPSPAGDFVFVAGMPGIDPKTDTVMQGHTLEVDRLNQDDTVEAERPFYAPRRPVQSGSETSGQQASSEFEESDMAMFDRFLAANPKYRRTPQPQRERLFREFQDWRRMQR
jgi:hypothetical protein